MSSVFQAHGQVHSCAWKMNVHYLQEPTKLQSNVSSVCSVAHKMIWIRAIIGDVYFLPTRFSAVHNIENEH
jgi:hypothetical protein